MPIVKELPNDLITEKTVLGLMLVDDSIATNILSNINLYDFSETNPQNRTIFSAIKRVKDKNQVVDIVTVTNELEVMKQYEAIGGYNYLVSLTELITEKNSFEYYVNILKDMTVLRELIKTVRNIDNEYNTKGISSISEFVNRAESDINEVTKNRRVNGFRKTKDIAESVTNEILARIANDGSTIVNGIPTGFSNLDNLMNGFKPGELIYLAARPAVGKTALALNMCYNAARSSGKPVAIFEMEMQGEALFTRLLASRSSVELDKINRGFLNKQDKLKIRDAAREIASVPLYIDDNSGSTVDDIILKATKLKNELGEIGLIMVDYIGIISDPKFINKNDSRQNLVGSYSRKLKELALQLKVPVLVLSQLTRKVEERDNKKPQISDLRESGNLEQDADKVLLIYRPAYYEEQGISLNGNQKFKKPNPNGDMPLANQKDNIQTKTSDGGDIVTLTLAKHRNGAPGSCTLLFFKQFGKFAVPSLETEKLFSKINQD